MINYGNIVTGCTLLRYCIRSVVALLYVHVCVCVHVRACAHMSANQEGIATTAARMWQLPQSSVYLYSTALL